MEKIKAFILKLLFEQVTGLGGTDIMKILKGAAIAAAGGVLAYLSTALQGVDDSTIVGVIASAVGAILVNVLRKFVDGTKE